MPTERDAESKQRRVDMWQKDMGFTESSVTYKQISEGIKKIPDLPPEVLNNKVLRAAFRTARGSYDGLYDDKDDPDDMKIQWQEFRVFLCFIKLYFRFYVLFDSLDESGDGKITLDEFKSAQKYLEEWNVKMDDPEAEFKTIDKTNDGSIDFKEFVAWAIQKSLSNDENGGKDVDEAAIDVAKDKMGEGQ